MGYTLSYTASDINQKLGKVENNAKKIATLEDEVNQFSSDLAKKVPSTRTINGKALSSDISLSASDVGALPNTTEIPTVPSNVSAFINDANYLTSIPAEYITEAELEAKGYLKEHQSLDGLATEDYVKSQIENIPTPDVSGQIDAHNASESAHNDIRLLIDAIVVPTKVSQLDNDKGYLTEHQSLADYAKTADLGDLASKDTVEKTDLSSAVQESLNKADNALQSYAETDPTVPDWAKAATKPSYTASEVGADASGTAESFIATHNEDADAHMDIRESVGMLANRFPENEQAGKIVMTSSNGNFIAADHDASIIKVSGSARGTNVEEVLQCIGNDIALRQPIITGTAGDFVVIGDDGNVTTKAIPYAEEATF